MDENRHIDELLSGWEFDPHMLNVRLVQGADGRELIQMRVDLGILQLETTGRPDGKRPGGLADYLNVLLAAERDDEEFEMDEDQCFEADREFLQFYHRRIAWLRLNQYSKAVADADHTLALMNICRDHSPDDEWTVSHEQYRPFVLFHRTQAAALAALDADDPAAALRELQGGLDTIQSVFKEHDAAEAFEEDEMVERLRELQEKLRSEYPKQSSLQEQLDLAVKTEQYELAAQLRDQLNRGGN